MTAKAPKPARTVRDLASSEVRGPFSRPVDVRRLSEAGLAMTIEATPAECAALAAVIDLPAIASLAGRFDLRRRAGGRIAVSGHVSAMLTQLCVVSLEPFEGLVEQDVDLLFAPTEAEARGMDRAGDRRRDRAATAPPSAPVPGGDEQADPPEPLVDDTIDLGAVAAEFVALALDPYPRRPGASFDDIVDRDAPPRAFAALERLKAQP